MFYEGFSANMKRELIDGDIGIPPTSVLPKLTKIVIEKIQELAEARLAREEFSNESAKEARRKELVSQLHAVVADMTDRMIARLNSNSFIRVPNALYAWGANEGTVCSVFCGPGDGFGV